MRADQFLYVFYVLQYVNGHADLDIKTFLQKTLILIAWQKVKCWIQQSSEAKCIVPRLKSRTPPCVSNIVIM